MSGNESITGESFTSHKRLYLLKKLSTVCLSSHSILVAACITGCLRRHGVFAQGETLKILGQCNNQFTDEWCGYNAVLNRIIALYIHFHLTDASD